MDIIKEKWAEILDYIRVENNLTNVSFETWLKPLKIHEINGSDVTIFIPSEKIGRDYIDRKFGNFFKVAISEITGFDVNILYATSEQLDTENNSYIEKTNLLGLNPKYTFNTFVVGKNNEIAHAASLAVAEEPGERYNPLFLYGGVGLGKTHLMHSIAHFINKSRPDFKILYVTSEEFTNQVIDAIRSGSAAALTKLREKYRNIDVLLVDDVQFIIGKESTQEEFFHTFNALHSARKQIILSSDRPPKDMVTLEERIKSRFEWGLMVDIQSPDYETRIAILHKKMDMEGYYVGNDVIEYIAQNVKSNIRELEGSLNKVMAFSHALKVEPSIEIAKRALSDIIPPEEKKTATPDDIIEYIANFYKISVDDIKGEKKPNKIKVPRQICMYMIRELTDTTLAETGKVLGGKHHTTISHGIEVIEKMMNDDKVFEEEVERHISYFRR